jgi:hypothetical protein
VSLLDLIQKRLADNPALGELAQCDEMREAEPLENVLKGQAVELWSDSVGRLFIVADQEDAQAAMERFGARRGEIYTAAEARRIIAVKDPAVVAEIHDWKQRFDGVVGEFRDGDHPK